MFDKLMNNYYFGKSGKGDYTPDDLPKNRWQLFMEMLKVRFSALIRLNLMYVVVWIPTILVVMMTAYGSLNVSALGNDELAGQPFMQVDEEGNEVDSGLTYITMAEAGEMVRTSIYTMLLLLIPCVTITGPATAGVSYVVRNWSRDEHAFIWSDFKDAVKENWKQSLLVSFLTSLIPIIVYMCWQFYGELSMQNALASIPQILVLMLGILWFMAVTYMHPLIVSYHLKTKDLFRNAFLLTIARLPMSVGIRLLHLVPMVIFTLVFFTSPMWGILVAFIWYVLIGFSLSRFVSASYCNAVFDRYINSRIPGAKVNRGLSTDEEDEDDTDEDEDDDEDESVPEE